MTASLHRWLNPVVAVLAALAIVAGPAPAMAEPTTPVPSGHGDNDDPPLLKDVLYTTNRSYVQAKARLAKSVKRQLELALELQHAQSQVDALAPQVAEIARYTYRNGRINAVAVLLNSQTPDAFVQRGMALETMNMVNAQKLEKINQARKRTEQAKAAIDAEVREQKKQRDIIAKQKRTAEQALALVGGRGLTGGLVVATSPVARMAPGRDSDGDWRSESCTENDPTTDGCITPRTLHAYKEVRRVGFNRFAGCYRSGGPYEHPKGRACDWSLLNRGFQSAYNTDMKMYGNNLAAFLVRNADRLGIYYVIWYRQIWFPATGWKSYSGPSNHTDHVHMSLL